MLDTMPAEADVVPQAQSAPVGTKWCCELKQHLPRSAFGKNSARYDGLQTVSRQGRKIRRNKGYGAESSAYKRKYNQKRHKQWRKSLGLSGDDQAIYICGPSKTAVEVKVGHSKNPRARRGAFTSTIGHDVIVLHAWKVPGATTLGAIRKVEGELHKALVRRGFYRKHGSEMFARSAFEARTLIRYVQGYARRKGWVKLDVAAVA